MAVTASIALESRIGLPALSDELGELGSVLFDQLRQLHQQLGAGSPGLLLPGGVGGKRGAHSEIDVFLIALRQVGDDLAIAGIESRERLAADCGTELAVDQCPPRFNIRFRAGLSVAHTLVLPVAVG